MDATKSAFPNVRAEPIACALRDRVLGLGTDASTRYWRGVLLTSGEGAIINNEIITSINAPCLAWFPSDEGQIFRIKAGCVGYQFMIDDQVLVNAIGHNPESADLRYFLDRQVTASLADTPGTTADAEHAFDMIVREIHRPRSGSWIMVQAQVRAVLVLLWRIAGGNAELPRAHGQTSRILLQFRQLLESHFHDRWSVQTYAKAIGVSPDRLHDICRRELDRSPINLVHDRVIYEARLRLERSTESVDQVAGSLGFRDVGHFSRFFKSKVGTPPGAYRDRVAQSASAGTEIEETNFSDWP